MEIRRRVHAHPELGHRESATTALIMRMLDADGIKAAVLPTGTGIIAEVGSGDRLIGLRADINALPIGEATGGQGKPSTSPQGAASRRRSSTTGGFVRGLLAK